MPRQWPPLTAEEIIACLKACGWQYERTAATHQVWINPATRQIVIVDVKWQPVSSRMLQHVVEQEMGMTRVEFYCATKATAKKIDKRVR